MRPGRLVMVLGTSTGVGKTWVTAELTRRLLDQGRSVAARKPAQSFAPGEVTDAEILARASGEPPGRICLTQRWYERPLAPPMAAEALGRPAITMAQLGRELTWPEATDVVLVEGAGGVRSPLAIDGDAVDLAAAVAPDLVVLVADPGLGTLNLVRMGTDALRPWPVVVFLNRFHAADDLHRRNRDWLRLRMALTVDTDLGRLSGRLFPDPQDPG